MNLLLWTTHVTEETFGVMAELKETGFDAVEIPLGPADPSHYQKIRKELDRLGLQCTVVTVVSEETNPASPDAKIRKAALEHFKWVVDVTAILGSDVICGPFHSAHMAFSGKGPTEEEKKWSTDVLRQAAEFAQPAGITLAIEYLNRFETYLLTNGADTKALVERVDHPNLKMMYDTHHSHIEDKSSAAVIESCADVIKHVHISESDRGTPGKGQVRWEEVFRALKKIDYDGWFAIEAFCTSDPEFASAIHVWREFSDPKEIYTEGLKFMKRMWETA